MKRIFALLIVALLLSGMLASQVSAATQESAPDAALDPLDRMLQAPFVKRDHRSIQTIARALGIELPLAQPWVLVEKSKFKLSLYNGETLIKSYPVSFGFHPIGDKVREGDGRTPEGEYYVCQKAVVPLAKQRSLGTRWMRLSYPNDVHAARGLSAKMLSQEQYDKIMEALATGAIPLQYTRLGGGIGIHGGCFDCDDGLMARTWTLGCVGLYNSDVEDLYRHVPVGTRVSVIP